MMKKLKLILAIMVVGLSFNACQQDDDLEFVAQEAGDFTFNTTFLENYVLNSTLGDNLAERFTWNNADFAVPTNVTYKLQAATMADFSDYDADNALYNLGATSGNEIAVTVSKMLALAQAAGLDNDPETDAPNTGKIYFRLMAVIGDDGLPSYSAIQALNVELQEQAVVEEEPLKNLFLVGDATAAGWSNSNNNPPIIRHPDNANLYTYRAYFAPDVSEPEGFKLLEHLGQWQPQWGAGENAGEVAVNESTGDDPSAFVIPSNGYYEFNLDIENMTYTLEAYDTSSATTQTTIGIIGDSTPAGWDADTDMTQSEFDPHIWYINGVALIDGEMKFRADNDWAVNWGNETELSGFGVQEGANIPVTAGIYDIWFNDLDGGYIFIAVE